MSTKLIADIAQATRELNSGLADFYDDSKTEIDSMKTAIQAKIGEQLTSVSAAFQQATLAATQISQGYKFDTNGNHVTPKIFLTHSFVGANNTWIKMFSFPKCPSRWLHYLQVVATGTASASYSTGLEIAWIGLKMPSEAITNITTFGAFPVTPVGINPLLASAGSVGGTVCGLPNPWHRANTHAQMGAGAPYSTHYQPAVICMHLPLNNWANVFELEVWAWKTASCNTLQVTGYGSGDMI